jgi:hypothetical protein
MQCLICEKDLPQMWSNSPGQPEGALCFTGRGYYGSTFDGEPGSAGFDGFEIYVCDECWPKVQGRALVFKLPLPRPQVAYESFPSALRRTQEKS